MGLLHQDSAHCRLQSAEFPRVHSTATHAAAQSTDTAAALAQPTVTRSVLASAAASLCTHHMGHAA